MAAPSGLGPARAAGRQGAAELPAARQGAAEHCEYSNILNKCGNAVLPKWESHTTEHACF